MTRPLWTLAEVVAATGGNLEFPEQKTGGPEGVPPAGCGAGPADRSAVISGISIDTRSLAPGDLFVPLTDARDGHEFVPAAFAKGAVAALVREAYARQPGDDVLIRVGDPLKALECLGIAARRRLAVTARVIAVTGSAGKTGTKEMLRACLRVCASSPERVHAPEKSFNNHWGVPLTLARMPADTEFGVFEIGMNHAGEIRPLAKMVRPHVAIVTNVLPVHVGNFPDGIEGVAKAKAEIFEGLEAGGTAIIPGDSPNGDRLFRRTQEFGLTVATFGGPDADIAVNDLHLPGEGDPTQHVRAIFRTGSAEGISFRQGMRGGHLANNALAVLLTLRVLGCDVARASVALADVKAAAGRGARETLRSGQGAVLLLDESYNANPASMAAALSNLAAVNDAAIARRIAVMGDMLELGAEAVRYHVGLLDAASRADLVFCCGPNMRHLHEALPPDKRGTWAPTSSELILQVLAAIRPGDAVMVKGSLGSRMAPIVEAIKKRFASA
jgi:UDP-N-acetylmuramoyl-tripeptide--D-alanyl-D-alanine ligase